MCLWLQIISNVFKLILYPTDLPCIPATRSFYHLSPPPTQYIAHLPCSIHTYDSISLCSIHRVSRSSLDLLCISSLDFVGRAGRQIKRASEKTGQTGAGRANRWAGHTSKCRTSRLVEQVCSSDTKLFGEQVAGWTNRYRASSYRESSSREVSRRKWLHCGK